LNVIERGANYGWPVISYGWQCDGGPIGRGIVEQEGMKQPLWVWTPAIAPSGMVWYTGDRFPEWRGSIFVGSMAMHHLDRLSIGDGRVVAEERLLLDRAGRIRSVTQGPEGFLYVGSDDGNIFRVVRRHT
jgi:aldose sugar dehydrogenase